MQRRAAHELDVEVPLPQAAFRGLSDEGERLGEQVVECVEAGLALGDRVADPIEAFSELAGEGAQLLVGAALHLRLERADLGHDGLQRLEFAAFTRVQELVEESHVAAECTGGSPGVGPRHAPESIRSGSVCSP